MARNKGALDFELFWKLAPIGVLIGETKQKKTKPKRKSVKYIKCPICGRKGISLKAYRTQTAMECKYCHAWVLHDEIKM